MRSAFWRAPANSASACARAARSWASSSDSGLRKSFSRAACPALKFASASSKRRARGAVSRLPSI
ncbi:MAG: hypothetical protein AB1556_06755 [Bacillota bacterium]